jgi:8-oxo-dGTP diphosphatase
VRNARLADVILADPEKVRLTPVSRPGPLPFDHPAIVTAAKKELRRRYAERPDPGRLLGARFTMRELQGVHEAIMGTNLQKDTFRRAMESHLRGTETWSSGTVGRPSQRFGHAR